MTKPIRILIADDHRIVRIGLVALLGTEQGLQVVGEAEDGETAIAETLRLKPDVVIMDLMMPRKDGVAATLEILAALPQTKILILTTFGKSNDIARALNAGASGALMKTANDAELVNAIRAVMTGQRVIAPEVKRLISEDPPVAELTARQLEVLYALSRGLSNPDISKQLDICEDRVKSHVNAILQKLGAANRTEAVAIAYRKHLLKNA